MTTPFYMRYNTTKYDFFYESLKAESMMYQRNEGRNCGSTDYH